MRGGISSFTTRPPTTVITVPAATSTDKISTTVRFIFDGVNNERTTQNLQPLNFDSHLEGIAQTLADDMITRKFFSNTDPQNSQVLFRSLLSQKNYTYTNVSANIAEIKNQGSFVPSGWTVISRYSAEELADQFVSGSIKDNESHQNMLGSHFNRTGIAISSAADGTRIVVEQLFTD
jgi:uncharacterized protein YkwD